MIDKTPSRYYTLALVFFPVALLILNDSWAFTNPQYALDPWFYTGLFVHFPDHLSEFAGSYYVARLPHIALGAAAHYLLPLPFAAYALRFIYWYLAVLSLYGTLRRALASDLAAFVSAVIFGTSVYFLWAIGWDYVDGACVAFMCGAAYFLTVGTTRRQVWRQALGAALQLCAVSTYAGLAFLVPLQLVHAFVVRRRERLPQLNVIALLVGWTGGFTLFGLVSSLAGGPFNYMAPQLRAAVNQASDREAFITPISQWILNAPWLFLPLLATLCAVTFLATKIHTAARWSDVWRIRGVAESVQCLVAVAVFAGAELRGFWFLQLSFVSSYLMPFTVPAIGAALSAIFGSLDARRARHVAVVATGVALVSFLPFVSILYPRCTPECLAWAPLGVVLFVAVAVLLVIATATSRASVGVAGIVLLLGTNLVFVDPRALDVPPGDRRHGYETIVAATRKVGATFPGRHIRFWYDYSEDLGDVYRSIASTYIWSPSLVGEDFPKLDGRLGHSRRQIGPTRRLQPDGFVSDRNRQLSPGDDIVVPTTRPTADVTRAFRDHGVVPRVVSDDQLSIDGKPFHLVGIELKPVGTLVSIPLDQLHAENGSVHKADGGEVEVVTRDSPYTYAAGIDLREALKRVRGSVVLAVGVKDADGDVGLCVLNAGESGCLASTVLNESSNPIVYLTVPSAELASRLIFESLEGTEVSRVVVSSLGVLEPTSQ